MLTQATNLISWALDGVLDNLLRLLNALGYLLLAPFKFLFKWIFQPVFGYILKAIFGNSLPGVGMFLGVLVLLFVAFWVIYAWPAFFGALLLVPFLGGLFAALGNLFRFGAKTLIAAGIIWIFWQVIKAANRLLCRADMWVSAKRGR